MDNSVDQQRLDEYQKRVADWISKQGIFFQMRYAGTLGGGSIARQLGTLLLRLLVILLLCLGVAFFALNRYFSGEEYREKVTAELGEVLGADSIEAKKFERARGVSTFQDLEIEGGEESFFYQASIEQLAASSNLLTGITTKWAPDQVRMKSAFFEIKAGGDQDDMERSFAMIVESFSKWDLESIEIEELSCEWGYSKITYGKLDRATFRAIRDGGVWEITIKGGRFSQNWLKDFDINQAKLICGQDGVKVEELSLSKNGGELELKGAISGPAARPNFDLKGRFKSLPILSLLRIPGLDVREYMSGSISGDLVISGSTDHRVVMEGKVELVDDDMVTLREKWDLLRAVSVLDVDRTYRRIDFEEGGFSFKTERGGMEIRGINLIADSLAALTGGLTFHLPSQKEAAEALGIVLTEGVGKTFESDATDVSAATTLEDERMSLKGAAGLMKDNNDEFNLDEYGALVLSDAQSDTMTPKQLDEARMRHEMNIYRVRGALQFGVASIAFAEYENLKKVFPVDPKGWRWVPFEVRNTLTKVSSEIAEKVLEEARRKNFSEEE
ncbi:translocation/assembly module TamB [Akkermansiaceae bacterium]|nr:translocation/assembly module TamB [Akkermansiaceae bacterium]MDB4537534.1 translocation/assembly module TamB [Akkermansiaceae bacterium]